MARLLEHHAKQLLAQAGLAVPQGEVADTPDQAAAAAERLGGAVVVKALVPAGRRGKAGAVRFAATPAEAAAAARALLAMRVGHYPVRQVLVEQRLPILQELYAVAVLDEDAAVAAVVVSTQGGVEVETLAARQPPGLRRLDLPPGQPLQPYQARLLWADAGLSGPTLRAAAGALIGLWEVFQRHEATVVEANPLAVLPDGTVSVAGALMAVDDDALFRHPELKAMGNSGADRAWRPPTERERIAAAADALEPYRGTARYTDLPPELSAGSRSRVGFIGGGGGASLLLMDALRNHRLGPANYTEIGGNPSAEKAYRLAQVVLGQPGLAGLLVCENVTNNTQVDLMAQGILQALAESRYAGTDFPVVMRLAGVGEQRAREVAQAGAGAVEYHADDLTMEQAVARLAQRLAAAPAVGSSASR